MLYRIQEQAPPTLPEGSIEAGIVAAAVLFILWAIFMLFPR